MLTGAKLNPEQLQLTPLAMLALAGKMAMGDLPTSFYFPKVRALSQNTSSCVGHSHSMAVSIGLDAAGTPMTDERGVCIPSPRRIYQLSRCRDRAITFRNAGVGIEVFAPLRDVGTSPHDAQMAMAYEGVTPTEAGDPLDTDDDPITVNQEPTLEQFLRGRTHLIVGAYGIPSNDARSVAKALWSKCPVTCTFRVGSVFEAWTPGKGPLSSKDWNADSTDAEGGYHSVVLVGFERTTDGRFVFWGLNSWGSGYGDAGYFGCTDSYLSRAYDITAINCKKVLAA